MRDNRIVNKEIIRLYLLCNIRGWQKIILCCVSWNLYSACLFGLSLMVYYNLLLQGKKTCSTLFKYHNHMGLCIKDFITVKWVSMASCQTVQERKTCQPLLIMLRFLFFKCQCTMALLIWKWYFVSLSKPAVKCLSFQFHFRLTLSVMISEYILDIM